MKCLKGCYASMYSVNILNKLYQKLFQNVEIFSGKFSAKLSNQKKFLGTRFPGSDTFSTSVYQLLPSMFDYINSRKRNISAV